MSTFTVDMVDIDDTTVKAVVGFGTTAADNNVIVADANALADAVVDSTFGKVVLVTGRASLPVAFALSHAWAHTSKAVAVFDPKLNGYVVAVSHTPSVKIGDIIPA